MARKFDRRSVCRPGDLLVAAGNSRARFVGYRPGRRCGGRSIAMPGFRRTMECFFAGEFLKQASPGRNINYTEFWAGYKF